MQRLLFILRIFVLLMLVFALQKPLFMLMNICFCKGLTFIDWLDVMRHGTPLDATLSGYIVTVPLILTIISLWIPSLPLRKFLTPYYIIIATFISTTFMVDASLYEFWKFKLDATIFNYIDSPANAMASVSWWFTILRIILFTLMTLLVAWIIYRLTPTHFKTMPDKVHAGLQSTGFVILMVPLFIIIRGGIGESTANVGKVYFSNKEFLNHSAVNPSFSFIYSLGKSENFDDEYNYFDNKELAQLTKNLYPATPGIKDTLLTTQRPNILFIILESYGQLFLDSRNIAPNLNRLRNEGVFFSNCYSNSFRTDRGLISTLSGYFAFPSTSVMKMPAKSRHLPSIAASLKKVGYSTSMIYGGDINFTGMQGYFRTSGYDEIIADTDFPVSERQNAWGVNDDFTFKRLYETLIAKPANRPWHQSILTLSSHEPFEVPFSRFSDKIPNAFSFTDHCLGRFIEQLRKTPLWDNLLIVCIPDHGYPYPADVNHQILQRNYMLWLGGAVKCPKTITTVMNQSDFAATLLAQLDLPHSDFRFSRNVFSPSYTEQFAYSCSRGTLVYADSTGYVDYDANANRIADRRQSTPDMLKRLKAILQMSYDDLSGL